MAHLVKLGALTDELVNILTSYSPNHAPKKFNTHRDSALKSLRSSNYIRTNQFDVQNNLEGLEEKFRVYNKDPLADALHERLDELDRTAGKWTPEILQFLLLLSDQPVKKSALEDIEFLRPTEVYVEPTLKWADLVREDPELREKSIWRNIDYGAESSEDEYSEDERDDSEITASTTESTVDDDATRCQEFGVQPDTVGFQKLQNGQFWMQHRQDKPVKSFEVFPQKVIHITELQCIREVIFMLLGHPTSLFRQEGSSISTVTDFQLKRLSPTVFHEILSALAEDGAALVTLRQWVKTRQDIPLLQNFQDQVAIRLRQFDSAISTLQATYVAPTSDLVVSLMEVSAKLQRETEVIKRLSTIIQRIRSDTRSQPFRCLELLYDATCMSQLAGEQDVFEYVGRLFFDCFRVYLRPVRTWMEQGELLRNDKVFFVTGTDVEVDLVSIWHDRFKLRKTPEGHLHGPCFLAHAASMILNTGKSVVVLKELGQFKAATNSLDNIAFQRSLSERDDQWTGVEPRLDFDTVCSGTAMAFIPFSELFEVVLNDWIQSKRSSISSTLRQCLFHHCGLNSSLNALEKIYFMADGATSSQLTRPIFEKLDAGKASWNDRFTLTELVQSTIGLLDDVSTDHLRASVIVTSRYAAIKNSRKTVKALSMILLQYRMSWPVQVIIDKDSMQTYQAIFTFLLQVRRSAHLLEARLLHDPANVDSSADERALYYSLRSRLLWFTSTMYNYLTEVVIRANTAAMRAELTEAEDVDQMIVAHKSYVKRLRDQAMLGTRLDPIRKTILSMLDLSINLSDARAAHTSTQQQFASSTSSFRNSTRFRQSTTQTKQNADAYESSSDEEEPSILEAHAISPEDRELDYIDQLRKMKGTFDHLLKFVSSGLKGIARAGREAAPNWDVLAGMLETGTGYNGSSAF